MNFKHHYFPNNFTPDKNKSYRENLNLKLKSQIKTDPDKGLIDQLKFQFQGFKDFVSELDVFQKQETKDLI